MNLELFKFKPQYHISPPSGLLNDPNGFVYFKGRYHLFYQWNPFETAHGRKYWAHLVSEDLVNWSAADDIIVPDRDFDKDGIYSGTAIVEGDRLLIAYTGNVRDKTNTRIPYQCMATMDGKGRITKLDKPVIRGAIPGYTEHFRDPKLWYDKEKKRYRMLLGAQNDNKQGKILLFQSADAKDWDLVKVIHVKVSCYMCECPDYYELDDKKILSFCPQGVDDSKDSVSGYSLVDEEFRVNEFFRYDIGFDFYAPQTYFDSVSQRVVLIAWLGLPDRSYPDKRFGWTGALSFPRELRVRGGRIYQMPIRELKELRKVEIKGVKKEAEYCFECEDYSFELSFQKMIAVNGLELFIGNDEREGIYISYDKGKRNIVFDMTSCLNEAESKNKKKVFDGLEEDLEDLQILMDMSTIEVFINQGKYVFSSRIFFSNISTKVTVTPDILSSAEIKMYSLGLRGGQDGR